MTSPVDTSVEAVKGGWQRASSEPLHIIEANECPYRQEQLATQRFQRCFNEIARLQAKLTAETERADKATALRMEAVTAFLGAETELREVRPLKAQLATANAKLATVREECAVAAEGEKFQPYGDDWYYRGEAGNWTKDTDYGRGRLGAAAAIRALSTTPAASNEREGDRKCKFCRGTGEVGLAGEYVCEACRGTGTAQYPGGK